MYHPHTSKPRLNRTSERVSEWGEQLLQITNSISHLVEHEEVVSMHSQLPQRRSCVMCKIHLKDKTVQQANYSMIHLTSRKISFSLFSTYAIIRTTTTENARIKIELLNLRQEQISYSCLYIIYLTSFAMRKSFLMATQRGSQAPKWSSTVTPTNATMIRTAPQKNSQEKEACSK